MPSTAKLVTNRRFDPHHQVPLLTTLDSSTSEHFPSSSVSALVMSRGKQTNAITPSVWLAARMSSS
eukprot:7227269-Pyramimonas_sp.AAC.2